MIYKEIQETGVLVVFQKGNKGLKSNQILLSLSDEPTDKYKCIENLINEGENVLNKKRFPNREGDKFRNKRFNDTNKELRQKLNELYRTKNNDLIKQKYKEKQDEIKIKEIPIILSQLTDFCKLNKVNIIK